MSLKLPFFFLIASGFLSIACDLAPQNARNGSADAQPVFSEIVEEPKVEEVAKDSVADLWERLAEVTLPELPGELPDFSGTYQVFGEDGGYYFTVELHQEADTIIGTYCGGTDTRSDCGMPSQGAGDCVVRGIVKQGIGYLVFRSCYMGTTGLAKIRKTGHHIVWETIDYPKSDGMMAFCAAPANKVLIDRGYEKTYDFPARIDSLEIHSANFMMDLNHADSQYVYLEARVCNDADMQSFRTTLYAGKPVRIIRKVGEYMLSNFGDETFEAPVYEIAFNQYNQEFTGFVYHEDLAQAHFQDNRGNLFLLGLKAEKEVGDRDLEWVVLGDAFGFVRQSAGFNALNAQSSAYFPAYDFTVKDRKDLAYGNFTFFEMKVNPYAHDWLKPVFLWAWDGTSLIPILEPASYGIPVDYHANRYSGLLVISSDYRESGEEELNINLTYEMGGETLVEVDPQAATNSSID